jgi:hypothetical protein
VRFPTKPQSKNLKVEVRADLDGYLCLVPWRNLKAGATYVTIQLTPTGAIEGSLMLPPLAPIGKLEIVAGPMEPDANDGPGTRTFDDCVDSDGRFRVTRLLPGTMTVVIRLPGHAEPLARIADVVVPRLGTADDARLAAIDLRDHPALRPQPERR